MVNIDQLVQLINTAITNENNNQRGNAQNQIMQLADRNPTQFFLICGDILMNQKYSVGARHSTAVVTSNLLARKNNNNGKFLWDQVYQNQKQQFKNKVLEVLISNNRDIMKAGAKIIAVIASIQLPRQEWQDVIDSLAGHCTNTNINIKVASITTLGFICEHIKNTSSKINNRLSQQILGSIIISTRQPQQIMATTSLKALQDSLSFLQQMMGDARYRDTVFNVFINQFQKGKLIKNTYQALYQFVKVAGRYLSSYQKELTDLAEVHLQQRDQTTILNLQLWGLIGSEYAELLNSQRQRIGSYSNNQINFLQAVSQRMLPLIMKCLLIMKKREQEQEQMRLSAIRALEAFVKVCDKSVVDKILDSVSVIINSSDPYHQQATVMLFSTICQYPDKQLAIDIFNQGFQPLFNLLQIQNRIVVKNSLIGFIRLSQSLPEVFLLNRNIKAIVQILFGYVDVNNFEIRQIGVQILVNISEGLKQYPQPVSDDPDILLTRVVKYYAANHMKIHEEQAHVNQRLTNIIMNIVMNTSKRDIIAQLIDFMIEKYYEVINANISDPAYLIQQILSVLHTAILANKSSVTNNEIQGKLCDLLNAHFKKYGVQPEGLSVLGAMCTTFNKNFQFRAQNYWNFVIQGLNSVNQMTTFKAALSCIGDYARMSQTGFFNQANLVMKTLLQYIKGNLDRQLKIHIINCMGDLILSMQMFAQTYMDDIIQISDICFQAIYQMTNAPQQIDYVDQLKQSLIDMYSCCVFSVNSTKPCYKLFNHYGNLATFVVRTCDPTIHPKVDYLKSCLFLIYDSAAFYWNVQSYHSKVKQISESKQILNLVHLAQKHSDRKQIKELLEFIQSRKKV